MLPWTLWTLLALAVLCTQAYTIVARFLRLLLHIYFKKIVVHGANNLPREGPVILCPNHPNMMVDPFLVITECSARGRSPYVWAKGSLFQNKIAALILSGFGSVPVYRPRKADAALADVDSDKSPEEIAEANRKMFESTWKVLGRGNVMLLFPEGTSYTAPRMLKLRTGVARVATGFVKQYNQPIPIIPVGLNYFNKDHFRSQVMMEFGTPIIVSPSDVNTDSFSQNEYSAVKRLTHELEERMHELTLNAAEFKTIHIARAMRRLFLNTQTTVDPTQEVRLTRQIIKVLESEPENEMQSNEIKTVQDKVQKYIDDLERLRIKDGDILLPMPKNSLFQMFIDRFMYLFVLLPLATPGLLLNFPYYLIAPKLNNAAGYVESRSMFKIFAAAVIVPVHWLLLICLTWYFVDSVYAYALAVGLPVFLYSHIRVLEESRPIVENVLFLFNLATHADQVAAIRQERHELAEEVYKIVSTYADQDVLAAVQKSLTSLPRHTSLRQRSPSISDTLRL